MTVMKTRSWTEPVRSRRNDRNASCVSNRRKGRRKTLSRWWVWCGLLEFCCNFRQFKWNVLTKWCSSNVLNAWFVILKYEVHSASTSAVTLGHVIIVCHCHVGMCGIVILFRFGFGLVFEKKNLDSVRNEFGSVWFEKFGFGYCSYLLLMQYLSSLFTANLAALLCCIEWTVHTGLWCCS